jgi:hypothetical protein
MLADGPASVSAAAPDVTELALGGLVPVPVQAASPTSVAVTTAASTA